MRKLLVIILLLSVGLAAAHGGVEDEQTEFQITDFSNPVDFLIYSSVIIGFIFVISLILGNKMNDKTKKIFFILIVLPIVISTLYITGHTVYLNVVSETGGPVHWHADFEIWVCGEEVKLPPPESILDNKVGNAVLHHHNDNRIHVEGILIKKQDADLSQFFKTIGGSLTSTSIGIPKEDKSVETFTNGDLCNGEPGKLKVYVNGKLNQDMEEYVLSPYEQVPPGDCIIIDFSPGESETTDKICASIESYDVYEKE